jgi:DNA modification methylase
MELNKIYCINCVDGMNMMDEGVVDLTVTSPPYDNLRDYNGYNFDFENVAHGLFKVTKIGGVVVWVVGDRVIDGDQTLTSFRQALYFKEAGFKVHDVMIYRKKNTPFMRSNAYTNCFEFMFIFSKESVSTFNPITVNTVRQGKEMLPYNKGSDGVNKKTLKELKSKKTKTNIWSYAVGFGGTTTDKIAFNHPAVFPEKLARDHILSWSNEGDIVLDPMCGSGTTCKMAKSTNRNFIGFDISQEYCDIADQRLLTVE